MFVLETECFFFEKQILGKKFWNLFHLQPMKDQKVAASYVLLFLKEFQLIDNQLHFF